MEEQQVSTLLVVGSSPSWGTEPETKGDVPRHPPPASRG